MKKDIIYEENQSVKCELLNIVDYPSHYHDDFQIVYVVKGELRLNQFWGKYLLKPGDIHIIHPYDVHSFANITDNTVIILSFDTDYFSRVFPHFGMTLFTTNIQEHSFSKTDLLRDHIFSIVSETFEHKSTSSSNINNTAVSLFTLLMNNFRGFIIDESGFNFLHQPSKDYYQTDRMARIVEYVYENYQYKISLSDIADNENLNTYYLSHVFHKHVGMNFRDFLTMVRVEKSIIPVLTTDKSISRISQDVGFSDAKYFVKPFSDYMGCHPKEYRTRNASRVYSKSSPVFSLVPYAELKPVIEKQSPHAFVTNSASVDAVIEIDFAAAPIGPSKLLTSNPHALENLYESFTTSALKNTASDLTVLYKDVNAQGQVIELLQDFLADPMEFVFPSLPIIDNAKSTIGILTANGLRKPIYYIFELTKDLPKNIHSYGTNYISFSDENCISVLVFNPSTDKNATIDIVARNLSSRYKLVRSRLLASANALNYMAQLNFSQTLDEYDFESINAMSRPEVEFEILPSMNMYYSSIELEPYDVLHLQFKRLKN